MPRSNAKPTVLLIDDHALFRDSVCRFLEAEADVTVVGSVGSVAEARAVLEREDVNLVLLDYDLGERNGTEFMQEVEQRGFGGKLLMVTAGLEPRKAAELLEHGISGVFLKHSPPEALKQAIHEVLAGNTWFEKDYLKKVVQSSSQPPRSSPARFTERENQVLSFVLDGLANKEIGDRLQVSESSVKSTMQQLFQKTGVRTRGQLVRVALERMNGRNF